MKQFINNTTLIVLCLSVALPLLAMSRTKKTEENVPRSTSAVVTKTANSTVIQEGAQITIIPNDSEYRAIQTLPANITLASANVTPTVTPKAGVAPVIIKSTPVPPKLTVSAKADAKEELKKWDSKLNMLQTDFGQTTSYDGILISSSKGELFYQKSCNCLRLDTFDQTGKVGQSAVKNGDKLTILDEKGKKITDMLWSDWQENQPNKALFDFGNYKGLVDTHTTTIKSETDKEVTLWLVPKGKEYNLYIVLSKQDYFPRSITIEAEMMQTTAVLSNTQKNINLKTGLFQGTKK